MIENLGEAPHRNHKGFSHGAFSRSASIYRPSQTPHSGRFFAKLAGDASKWPSSGHYANDSGAHRYAATLV